MILHNAPLLTAIVINRVLELYSLTVHSEHLLPNTEITDFFKAIERNILVFT